MRKGQHHSSEARVKMSQAKIGNKNALHATRTLETRTKIGIAQVGNKKRETHGMYGTRVYKSWSMMKNRCLNSNYTEWHLYGGRGIIVCDRWLKFENFYNDMGDRPEGTSIDRYPDPAGNYEPGNCRWATPKEQRANQRKEVEDDD